MMPILGRTTRAYQSATSMLNIQNQLSKARKGFLVTIIGSHIAYLYLRQASKERIMAALQAFSISPILHLVFNFLSSKHFTYLTQEGRYSPAATFFPISWFIQHRVRMHRAFYGNNSILRYSSL